LHKHDSLHIALEELQFSECFQNVTESLRSLLENTRTKIVTDFSAVSSLHFNKAYLKSIFLNLITNSIKYARPDCDPIIQIRSVVYQGQTQLHFSDNGQGFDMEEVKDRIFGLNQTFHNHSDSKGIGLYLVYSHMTSLGGQITVDSQPNQGTHFTLTFARQMS
jgi:signal transduction histidine kinase